MSNQTNENENHNEMALQAHQKNRLSSVGKDTGQWYHSYAADRSVNW